MKDIDWNNAIIVAMRSRIRRLEKDAARINWLHRRLKSANRKPREQEVELTLGGIPKWEMDALLPMHDCTLRKFIDAAIKAKKPKP